MWICCDDMSKVVGYVKTSTSGLFWLLDKVKSIWDDETNIRYYTNKILKSYEENDENFGVDEVGFCMMIECIESE